MDEKLEKLKVLVVDDEEGMRSGIERVLRKFSVDIAHLDRTIEFSVHQAESGEEGLEIMKELSPHILLLDNKLPGMSGIEMLTAIAGLEIDVLIIMITAYASIETAVKATKFGAYDFLPKPFTPDELKTVVRKAVRQIVVTIQAREFEEERRQVRFQFISVLAHELKSPINAIESYLKIMDEHTAGDDPKVYEHMVSRSLTRLEFMKKLIIDLLDMTRIESGQRNREIVPVNIGAVADTALDSVRETAKSRGITLELNIENEREFSADQSEIEIIFNNLVSNAVKYNNDNGNVTVHVIFNTEDVKISVSDTGIGLTEEEMGQLFHDFVRIKKQETKKILGSGLGLSIVKTIAEIYNGSVNVESRAGNGSTFTVVLKDVKDTTGSRNE